MTDIIPMTLYGRDVSRSISKKKNSHNTFTIKIIEFFLHNIKNEYMTLRRKVAALMLH